MTRRLFSITAWLAVGHALLLGLFWGLLQVPESNAAMLALSALAAVSMLAVAAWVEGVALVAWSAPWRAAVRRALPAPLPGVIALAVFAVVWLLTAQAKSAWLAHSGEIDAWLMRHVGWTRTAGLHSTFARVISLVRFAGGLVALTIVAWTLHGGLRTLVNAGRWLAAALSPRRAALAALLFYGLVWMPWRAAYWRPRWVSPNWQELGFVGLKLAGLYLVANLGWAAILLLVQQGTGATETVRQANGTAHE